MLEFSYIFMSAFVLFVIFIGYTKVVHNKKSETLPNIIIPISVWLVYILTLSFSGILKDFSLPPRFPLLIFLPFFVLVILFYKKQKDNLAFYDIPLSWTTLYQSFRIVVEIILLYTFYKGIIPVEATFEGYNFDILIGISSTIIGLTLAKNVVKYKTVLLIWNIVGIIMVMIVGFLIGSSIYFPELWNNELPTVSTEFVGFPYLLIPGILAPSAIFMHVVSIIQIKIKTEDNRL